MNLLALTPPPGVTEILADAVNADHAALALATAAFAIADDSVRNDIEFFALQRRVKNSGRADFTVYSITQPVPANANGSEPTMANAMHDLAIVQRAAAYIRARGNNFGRRMLDVPDMPGYVRFVDREGRPLEEGEPA